MKSIIAVCAVLGVLCVAAAQEDAQEDDEQTKEVDVSTIPPTAEEACFLVRDVRNFDPLSNEFIFIEGRRGQNFLLTMFGGCFGLDDAIGIAIANPTSRVCSTSSAQITYRGLGGFRETCRVRKVESVEDKAYAARIVESRSSID